MAGAFRQPRHAGARRLIDDAHRGADRLRWIIATPAISARVRGARGDEAGKKCLRRMRRDQLDDGREHLLEPRHLPFGRLSEKPLHVHADVDAAVAEGSVPQLILL